MLPGLCPSAEELAALVAGALPDAALQPIADHLEGCPECEAAVEALERRGDPVVNVLRNPPSGVRPAADGDPAPSINRSADTTMTGATAPASAGPVLPPPPTVPGYEILGELGRGGMGVVYKALRLRLQRVVALKMLRAGAHATSQELARFLVEAEMVARLTHPHIVQIHEIGQHGGVPFVVFEFVEGGTLAERVRGRRWPARAAAELLETLARAVQHAHRCGVVHRDLKPANVLMAADGTPKIADFGLAKPAHAESGLTSTGAVLGTPMYMAPEQARGDRRVGPAADVYALGVILYELLAGRPPFQGEAPLEVLRQVVDAPPPALPRGPGGVPRDLATICRRCLDKGPARRYDSAEALADDLRRFLDGEPIRARRVGEAERLLMWGRRRPAVAGLLAGLAVTLLAGVVVSTYFGLSERQRKRDAVEARDEARAAKRASDLLAAELTFGAALRDAEAGLVDKGMFRLLGALRLAPADAADFRRVARANLAALGGRLPALRQVVPGPNSAAFVDPAGARFVTGGADGAVQVWDAATGRPAGPPVALPPPCRLFRVTGDGRVGLAQTPGTAGATQRLYDLTTGAPLGAPFPAGAAWFSADGRLLIRSRDIDPIDTRKRETRFFSSATGAPVGAPVPDDVRLLTGRDGRTILMTFPVRGDRPADLTAVARFRDLLTGEPLTRVDIDPAVGDPQVRFDGTTVLTADLDGTVRWWDPATGRAARAPWRPDRARPGAAAPHLSADARTLTVQCTDNRLRWYEVATGREGEAALTLPIDAKGGIELSADGLAVLVSSMDGAVYHWRAGAGGWRPLSPAHPAVVYREVAYSPDRAIVALSADLDNRFARLADTATGRPCGAPLDDINRRATFSADGALLATCAPAATGAAPLARVWDAATGAPRTPPLPLRTYIHALAFSPDGRTLAVGGIGATALFDVATGRPQGLLKQTAPVGGLAYSRDGKWLASGSRHGWTDMASCWCLWEVATGRAVGPPVPTTDAPLLHFAPDDRTVLALEFDDGRLRRWDATATAPGEGVTLHAGRKISHAVFRADAARLLTGYPNGTAQQWDTATGQPVGAPLAHPGPVAALAYSPDGQALAVGCQDGTVGLWDAATALPLSPPFVHRFPVLGLAFGADGATVRVTTTDGGQHVWPVPTPVPDDLDRLEAWVRAATGARLEGDTVVLHDPAGWRRTRQRLDAVWPEAAVALTSPPDPAAAHDRRARQAEADGDAFAARWHLDRLLALRPADETLLVRRATALARAGRFADAEADLARAGGPDAVLPGLRCQAYEARAREDWPVARWAFDRLVAARPDDWRPYADRAEVHARLGETAARDADRAKAVALGAEPRVVLRLVDDLAAAGRWREAAKALAGVRPLSVSLAHRLALLHLEADDTAGYRKVCQALLRATQQPGGVPDAPTANAIAWLCALGPAAVDDYAAPLALVEAALVKLPAAAKPQRAGILNTKGALLCRAGRPREARDLLQKSLDDRDGKGDADDWAFLAMCCYRLGDAEAARLWLDRMAAAPPESGATFSWRRAETELLRRQAEALVRSSAEK